MDLYYEDYGDEDEYEEEEEEDDDDEYQYEYEGEDRISTLPDNVIHHIFSFLDSKHAVQCSILSNRWKDMWTSLPFLNFLSNQAFDTTRFQTFDFMTSFFIMRNHTSHLLSLNFHRRDYVMTLHYLSIIVRYAVSHNVEEINVHTSIPSGTNFPMYMFNSNTLRVLKIAGFVCASTTKEANVSWFLPSLKELHISDCISPKFYWSLPRLLKLYISRCTQPESFLNMPNLTCLYMEGVAIYRDNVSELVNLESLSLFGCKTSLEVLNVSCPRLKCLRIRYFRTQGDLTLVISAPSLVSMYLHIGKLENLVSCRYVVSPKLIALDEVQLDVYKVSVESCDDIKASTKPLFQLLNKFRHASSLTIDANLVEILAYTLNSLKKKPSPFKNLKSLKLQGQRSPDDSDIPSVVRAYLPTHSSSAISSHSCAKNLAMEFPPTVVQTERLVEDFVPLNISRSEQRDLRNRAVESAHALNAEGQDRISNLPDVLIHHLLSFVDVKYAVQASTLSKRWKSIWTTLPYINFMFEKSSSKIKVYNSIAGFFITRNHQSKIYSLTFHSQVLGRVCGVELLGTLVRYAILRDVQVLSVHASTSWYMPSVDRTPDDPFPICMFVSPSLRSLSIEGLSCVPSANASWHLPSLTDLGIKYCNLPQSHLNLPNVTTLHLAHCVLPESLLGMLGLASMSLYDVKIVTDTTISELVNLKSLTLDSCCTIFEVMNILCPRLKTIKISDSEEGKYWMDKRKLVNISAPKLSSFEYNIPSTGHLPACHFNIDSSVTRLKEVKLDIFAGRISYYYIALMKWATAIFQLLDEFQNTTFLTLGWNLIEVLSIALDELKNEPSPFKHLKFLKVHWGLKEKKEPIDFNIPKNVTTYLLGGSPDAIIVKNFL